MSDRYEALEAVHRALEEQQAAIAVRQAELVRAWLAGYGQALEEARGLLGGCASPPQARLSEEGAGRLRRLLRAFGLVPPSPPS
jgi:hypothetical protein